MEPFIGQIIMVGFQFAPTGWALCNGQILRIAENQALYALLGNIYGGDGIQTFALPDLRGKVPLGMGQYPNGLKYELGQVGGEEAIKLSHYSIPEEYFSMTPPSNETLPTKNIQLTTFANATEKESIEHLPPYQVCNYIIATVGIFPTRD